LQYNHPVEALSEEEYITCPLLSYRWMRDMKMRVLLALCLVLCMHVLCIQATMWDTMSSMLPAALKSAPPVAGSEVSAEPMQPEMSPTEGAADSEQQQVQVIAASWRSSVSNTASSLYAATADLANAAGDATLKYGTIASDAAKATTAASLEYGAAMAKEAGAATVKYGSIASDAAKAATAASLEYGTAKVKEAGAATVKYGSIASDAAKAATAASLEYGTAKVKEAGAATAKYGTAAADVAAKAGTVTYEAGVAVLPIVKAVAVMAGPMIVNAAQNKASELVSNAFTCAAKGKLEGQCILHGK
jgi:hypothetical protein